MAQPGSDTPDLEFIWSIVKWFLGGVSALFSMIATALLGKIYREHNKIYAWYNSATDPEKVKLKEEIDRMRNEALEKCYKDVAELKHDFSQIKLQLQPILKTMADNETLVEVVGKLEYKIDNMARTTNRKAKTI